MEKLPAINFVRHNDINQILWNESIFNSINGNIYANYWYLDVVTENKWDALISDDYKWLMPLPAKKKFGFKYLPTPVFVQQLGIYGPGPFTEEICYNFIKHLDSNFDLIDYQINHYNIFNIFEDFKVKERKNLILKLNPNRDLIQKEYSDGIKRKLSKANSNNLKVNLASIRSIIKLFQDNKEKTLKNWNFKNYTILEQLFHMSSLRKTSICVAVYNEKGNIICGAMILEYKNTATFIFSGNSEEGKEKGALPFLINDYIMNAPKNIFYFDFEGSDNEGLYQFYSGFGAKEYNYLHLKKNNLPFYIRLFKR